MLNAASNDHVLLSGAIFDNHGLIYRNTKNTAVTPRIYDRINLSQSARTNGVK